MSRAFNRCRNTMQCAIDLNQVGSEQRACISNYEHYRQSKPKPTRRQGAAPPMQGHVGWFVPRQVPQTSHTKHGSSYGKPRSVQRSAAKKPPRTRTGRLARKPAMHRASPPPPPSPSPSPSQTPSRHRAGPRTHLALRLEGRSPAVCRQCVTG